MRKTFRDEITGKRVDLTARTPEELAAKIALRKRDIEEGKVDPGFSKPVWDFIMTATPAALNRGEDIGPMPAWFARPAGQEKR